MKVVLHIIAMDVILEEEGAGGGEGAFTFPLTLKDSDLSVELRQMLSGFMSISTAQVQGKHSQP